MSERLHVVGGHFRTPRGASGSRLFLLGRVMNLAEARAYAQDHQRRAEGDGSTDRYEVFALVPVAELHTEYGWSPDPDSRVIDSPARVREMAVMWGGQVMVREVTDWRPEDPS